ncbi:site-2 protease family protein [Candidatus Pacearchaeota archaeon]|nr:site-2 protease family protein [Candidatus Pacearchaeota archaeon]|tara:strand:+ start:4146 stop:4742 length:597 start_codon:yes stop_codon:yes gene_type:complete
MRFSRKEKKDLFYAGIMLSLAFAILLSGGLSGLFKSEVGFTTIFLVAFLTAGIGFLLHELAHKYVAISYGLRAEFKAFYGMLWLAVGLSFFGFIIAAPGAVFIQGFGLNRAKNGKISLAGPVTNIVLAVLFMILGLFYTAGILGAIASFGFTINALLAAFNMIPVMPFDGAKVLAWDKRIYGIIMVVALGLFFLSWII